VVTQLSSQMELPATSETAGREEVRVNAGKQNAFDDFTIERAKRVLNALGVRFVTRVEAERMRSAPRAASEPRTEGGSFRLLTCVKRRVLRTEPMHSA
jgi:hypothetical protein